MGGSIVTLGRDEIFPETALSANLQVQYCVAGIYTERTVNPPDMPVHVHVSFDSSCLFDRVDVISVLS